MRNFIAAAVLVGGLLAGAGPAMADSLEGLADSLTLAKSGVLIPYITGGARGTVALIAVASPVAANPNLRMFFYDASCDRVGRTVSLHETVNDISFLDPTAERTAVVPYGTSGLVAIAGESRSGFGLGP